MAQARILIAEDDEHIRNGLAETLESEGYEVTMAPDGGSALTLARRHGFDLIFLDVMMPKLSGYDVCRELRKQDDHTPILMLTAKGEEIDKVVGLQLGADDYITKPFGIHELLARVAAALRRSRLSSAEAESPKEPFFFGEARVSPLQYRLELGGEELPLSARELAIICFFDQHPNEVLSRDLMLETCWGQQYLGTTRTLDQHIAQLRKKVERDPGKPAVITTVHGIGYRYVKKND